MPQPHKPILPNFPTAAGRTEAEELFAQARAGLEARLEVHVFTADMPPDERERLAKPYSERPAYEAEINVKMGFLGSFLIVSDFTQLDKVRTTQVGRGQRPTAGA